MKKKKTQQAKQDFTFAQLPHNRKEVFFDCIKMQWKTLLLLGVIALAFCLPLVATEFFVDSVWASLYQRFNSGAITEDELQVSLKSLQVLKSLISVLCWTVFAVGVSGIARVVRQLAWGDPIFFGSDFAQGIRQNVGKFAIVFAICAAVDFLSVFMQQWFSSTTVLAYLPFVLLCCFVFPVSLWVLSQTAVYKVKFGKAFKNGMAFFGKNIWQTMIFVLLFGCVKLVTLMAATVWKYVVCASFALLFPLYCLAWFLVCSHSFDEFINKNEFQELYDKGVYRMDSPAK